MLKKILRWSLVIFCILLIALAGVIWYANDYLESNQEKLLHEHLATKGMTVALREVRLEIWKDFPEISLTVDSLVIQDTTKAQPQPELLNAQRIATSISLKQLIQGRIRLKQVHLMDATVHLERDSSTGLFNLGNLEQQDTSEAASATSESAPISVDWEGLDARLEGVDLTFIDPTKRKRIIIRSNDLTATVGRNESGELFADTELDLAVQSLAFNTEKGSYLENTDLRGPLYVTFEEKTIVFEPTELSIGGHDYSLSADIVKEKTDTSYINVAAKKVTYERAKALLPRSIQEKLVRYYVSDTFAVVATIATPLGPGNNPLVNIGYELTGQDVRVQAYDFQRVHASGSIENRLEHWEGGLPNSKKNLRVLVNDLRAFYLGDVLIESPRVKVAVAVKDPVLQADLKFSGPAKAVSDYLKNDAFFFRRGRFNLETSVDASLLSFEDLVGTTDGKIDFKNTVVYYAPGGISFPFSAIKVGKLGEDISFDVASKPLPSGFTFELDGKIDNLAPLLISLPHGQINTDVKLSTDRLTWTDFLDLFGQNGHFSLEADEEEVDTTVAPLTLAQQVGAMKSVLLSLDKAFNPNIALSVDTLGYYDVFSLTDFTTGMHFERDTLVLEKTSFDWAGSSMNFSAKLDLDGPGETPFDVSFQAEHLNINEVRSSLNYFGLQLPQELKTLPRDMHIVFRHAGIIADSIGIVPGHNEGSLVFDDGRQSLFKGTLDYEPGAAGISSTVHLEGDPQVVNVLFAAENFFFGEGTFSIDLQVEGTPEDLPQIARTGKLALDIKDSRVHYKPADVYIPIEQFVVNIEEETAAFKVELVTDSTDRRVSMEGSLDQLTAFLFPDTVIHEPFQMKANLRAEVLGYSDLNRFIQSSESDSPSSGNLRTFLSTTGGVFNSFRPEMSLSIDTFWLTDLEVPLLQLRTGMYVRNDEVLVLDRTGFSYGDGVVAIDAEYHLDNLRQSLFKVDWSIQDLDLARMFKEYKALSAKTDLEAGDVEGRVSLTGHLEGYFDEREQAPLYDSVQGLLSYAVNDIVLKDWAQLQNLGKKALMEKRFETIRFAPLLGSLAIDRGRMAIPRTEIQSTALHLFVEGAFDMESGPDILVSVPLKNIGRGLLAKPPPLLGYAFAGWQVFLVAEEDEKKETSRTRFRLGRRKYYKDRGRMADYHALKARLKRERKARRAEKRKR